MSLDMIRPVHSALCLFLVSLLLAGCQTRDGVSTAGAVVPQSRERYLIIGFGVVTVRAPDAARARVVRERGVGVSLATQPTLRAGVGYVDYRITSVPADAEGRFEIKEDKDGKLTISVDPSASRDLPHPP